MFFRDKKKEDKILIKIEIQENANKEFVAIKKIVEKSTIKRSRKFISFDFITFIFFNKKFITTRIDKLIAQTIMFQQVNEKVDNFNKKLIDR